MQALLCHDSRFNSTPNKHLNQLYRERRASEYEDRNLSVFGLRLGFSHW